MNVLIYANCQAKPIARVLSGLVGDMEINTLPANYKLISGAAVLSEDDIENIRKSDVIIAQHLDAGSAGYRVEDILKSLEIVGKTIVKIPYVFFSAYWPDFKQVNPNRTSGFPFGLLWLDDFYQRGFTETDTLGELSSAPDESTRSSINEAVRSSISILREKEGNCDVCISDYLEANYRNTKLFHAACHPSIEVYLELSVRICAHLNIEIENELDSNCLKVRRINTYKDQELPIYPAVYDTLGLEFSYPITVSWGNEKLGLSVYIKRYFENIRKEYKRPEVNREYIINVGTARSGTTALHTIFEGLEEVRVPKNVKELKAFMDDKLNFDEYKSKFRAGRLPIYFESSPPYMHNGLASFNKYLKKMLEVLPDKPLLIFNFRPLAGRAFSHYWHDISKHHSVYGARWSVRSKDSPDRYQTVFSRKFEDVLARSPEKFCPDFYEMVVLASRFVGWENILILNPGDLLGGVNKLIQEIPDVSSVDSIHRVPGVCAPIFLGPGTHSVGGLQQTISIPDDRAVRIGADGIEILDYSPSKIMDIVNSSRAWTYSVSASDQERLFGNYLEHQSKGVRLIPEHCFYSSMNDSPSGYIKKIKDEFVKIQSYDVKKLLRNVSSVS